MGASSYSCDSCDSQEGDAAVNYEFPQVEVQQGLVREASSPRQPTPLKQVVNASPPRQPTPLKLPVPMIRPGRTLSNLKELAAPWRDASLDASFNSKHILEWAKSVKRAEMQKALAALPGVVIRDCKIDLDAFAAGACLAGWSWSAFSRDDMLRKSSRSKRARPPDAAAQHIGDALPSWRSATSEKNIAELLSKKTSARPSPVIDEKQCAADLVNFAFEEAQRQLLDSTQEVQASRQTCGYRQAKRPESQVGGHDIMRSSPIDVEVMASALAGSARVEASKPDGTPSGAPPRKGLQPLFSRAGMTMQAEQPQDLQGSGATHCNLEDTGSSSLSRSAIDGLLDAWMTGAANATAIYDPASKSVVELPTAAKLEASEQHFASASRSIRDLPTATRSVGRWDDSPIQDSPIPLEVYRL